ncbi:unnamed protein product, partial [Larinioides sclopetarius]
VSAQFCCIHRESPWTVEREKPLSSGTLNTTVSACTRTDFDCPVLNSNQTGPRRSVSHLRVFPRGMKENHEDFISLFLYRAEGVGPEFVSVKFELSILAEDGSVLSSKEYKNSFERRECWGSGKFLKIDESLYLRNFSRDVMTVSCKMWRGEGEVHRVAPICFRTLIEVETICFRHQVDNFSTLKPNQKHTIQIPSPLRMDCFVTSSLYFTPDSCRDGEMMVEITTSDRNFILCKRRISLIESRCRIWSREDDNRFDVERKDIRKLPLSLTRQDLLNKKSEYLYGDKLTLLCECSFSTSLVYEKMGETPHEMPTETKDQRKYQ